MGLLEELKAASQLKVYHNAQLGSLLDQSGNAINLGVGAGSGNTWRKVRGRWGYGGTAASELTAGVQASLDLTTATLFYTATFIPTGGAYLIHAVNKYNGVSTGYAAFMTAGTYNLLLGSAAGNQTFGVGSIVAGAPTHVAHAWDGAAITSWINGVQVDLRAQTKVSNSVGQSYRFGWPAATSGLHQVSIGMGGMVNRVLTGSEVARLYDEWMMSGPSADLPRRNFVQVPRGMTDVEYDALRIVLDTAFETGIVAGSRKVLDMGPNNYAGTLVGTPQPGQDGFGQRFDGVKDAVHFGDVTQLNSVAKFTVSMWAKATTANAAGGSPFWEKGTNANNRIGLTLGDVSLPSRLYVVCGNGANTYGTTGAAPQTRAGQWQHYFVAFDGGPVADADKLRVWVDGESVAMTYPAGAIPATTPNMAGRNLYSGATDAIGALGYWFGVEPRDTKVTTSRSVTAADVRRDYLVGARRVLLRETFEDVPVSLAAVSAGNMLGQWRVISGTWKCTESADGKRWLECVTAGAVAMSQPQAFGTWLLPPMQYATPAAAIMTIDFISVANMATYYRVYSANDGTGLSRYLGLARTGANLTYTANGYLLPNVPYLMAVNRRPSDGRFTMYTRGGARPTWVLTDTSGGGGVLTNPTAAETTTLTSSWCVVNATAGDKICLYDPKDPTVGFTHFQGQLDPTARELP